MPYQRVLLLPVRDNLPRRSAKLFVMTEPEFGRCHVDYALMVRGVANLFGGRRPLVNASDVIVTDVVAARQIMRLRTKAPREQIHLTSKSFARTSIAWRSALLASELGSVPLSLRHSNMTMRRGVLN